MNILVTGGTGLIGRRLCRRLTARGHRVHVWSRQPQRVPALCGAGVQGWASLDAWSGLAIDAVINLAGAPIADRRWTASRRQLLRASRITLTEQLLAAMAAAPRPPSVLLSGSAIGVYGETGEVSCDESAAAGSGFAADLCRDWEQAALAATRSGLRVCLLRTGLVLDRDGGVLGQMLPPFRLGLGGPIGNGWQWMSWIHIDDYVALVERLLDDAGCHGAYNLCAPNPVRNRIFASALGAQLRRPAKLPVPAPLLRLVLGEAASLLLGSQRVLPARAEQLGFAFAYPALDAALAQLLPAP